jgi:hypothetical protein
MRSHTVSPRIFYMKRLPSYLLLITFSPVMLVAYLMNKVARVLD